MVEHTVDATFLPRHLFNNIHSQANNGFNNDIGIGSIDSSGSGTGTGTGRDSNEDDVTLHLSRSHLVLRERYSLYVWTRPQKGVVQVASAAAAAAASSSAAGGGGGAAATRAGAGGGAGAGAGARAGAAAAAAGAGFAFWAFAEGAYSADTAQIEDLDKQKTIRVLSSALAGNFLVLLCLESAEVGSEAGSKTVEGGCSYARHTKTKLVLHIRYLGGPTCTLPLAATQTIFESECKSCAIASSRGQLEILHPKLESSASASSENSVGVDSAVDGSVVYSSTLGKPLVQLHSKGDRGPPVTPAEANALRLKAEVSAEGSVESPLFVLRVRCEHEYGGKCYQSAAAWCGTCIEGEFGCLGLVQLF